MRSKHPKKRPTVTGKIYQPVLPLENITHATRNKKRTKTLTKNKRDHSATNEYEVGLSRVGSGQSSRLHTFKSNSSHTSSLKTIYKDKLQDIGFIQEQYKEDLHSSSSADTISIKDKIVVPDAHKLKEYADSRTHKRNQEGNKNKVSRNSLGLYLKYS